MIPRAFLPLALAALACSTARAQARRTTAVPDHPCRWTPLTVNLPRVRFGPSAAEARAMKVQLDSLVAVLRRSPLLADPRGFETVGSETVAEDEMRESWGPGWQPVKGSLLIIPLLWYRQCDSCPPLRSDEGRGAQLGINSFGLLMPGGGVGGCGGPRVFTEPREIGRVGGFPVYGNGALLIAARDVPPFIPITRSEWIDAQINATKNARGCLRPDPRQAAWYDSIRGSWSPEERAMEAWEWGTTRQERGVPFQLLGRPGAPGSRRYVRINPALLDSTLPRTAMQTVVVTLRLSGRDPRTFPRGTRQPAPCSEPIPRSADPSLDALAVHEGIWCAVDWTAVRALLR